jgi:hypothetical protein
MCQSFFRCIAACLSIADPDLVDGSAIFFALGDATARENPPEPEASHAGHRNPWTDDSRRLKGGVGLWRLRGGGTEPSSLFVCPQLRLLRGDSSAVQFGKSQLPFVYQLCSLSRAPLGTGKHPLRMDALLRRFVQRLAGGMIGHTIPNAQRKDVQTDFIQAGLSAGERCLPLRAGARLNRVRLSFSGRLAMPSPRVVMLRGRWFVRLRFRFGGRVLRRGFRVRRG